MAEIAEAPSCNLAKIGGGISRESPRSHFKVELQTPDFQKIIGRFLEGNGQVYLAQYSKQPTDESDF